MNFKTIIDAWKIAHDPTPKQLELSEKRLKICETCEFSKEIIKGIKISNICTKCGCPLTKKIFTDIYNACPLEKWDKTDLDYFEKQKNKKTLL
jgi:hypothetical protein